MGAFHENPNRIHTELTFINPKAHNHKIFLFMSSTKIFEASYTNSVDPTGAVWSGSKLFASMLLLIRHFQMQLFLLAFQGLNNVFDVYTEIVAQDDK